MLSSQELLQLQISGGQTPIPFEGAILHTSVGTVPVKLFIPRDNTAAKKVKY